MLLQEAPVLSIGLCQVRSILCLLRYPLSLSPPLDETPFPSSFFRTLFFRDFSFANSTSSSIHLAFTRRHSQPNGSDLTIGCCSSSLSGPAHLPVHSCTLDRSDLINRGICKESTCLITVGSSSDSSRPPITVSSFGDSGQRAFADSNSVSVTGGTEITCSAIGVSCQDYTCLTILDDFTYVAFLIIVLLLLLFLDLTGLAITIYCSDYTRSG